MSDLFVHVPKTGGTTYLQRHAPARYFNHATAREIRARIGSEWDRLDTVTLVRNPFARLVSLWAFSQARDFMPFGTWLEVVRPASMSEWFRDADGTVLVGRVLRFEDQPRGDIHAFPGAYGDWRAHMTPEAIAYIAGIEAQNIEQFGYEIPARETAVSC